MKFIVKETGKKISIAVIEKETGLDLLSAMEGLLNEHDNGVDIETLPSKAGRIVLEEKHIKDVHYAAEALLGDAGDCYLRTWGL